MNMAKKIDVNDADYLMLQPTGDRILVKRDDGEERTESGIWYAKQQNKNSSMGLISFVKDRLGHDYRYAIDNSKIKNELDWKPKTSIGVGLQKTINWYLND